MRLLRLLIVTGTLAVIGAVAAQPVPETKIAMTPVKYDGLKQEVLKNRGKVVIVDFWATNCPPCIAALPHYVDLQKKFADKGLVVITVSVDPTGDLKRVEKANGILKRNEVALRNLILDEPYEMWTKKFDFVSLPFAYLFDRHGKWMRCRASDYRDDPEGYGRDVERIVLQMLNEK
jgi:thiol-disulfide isomerase/thioredoxin